MSTNRLPYRFTLTLPQVFTLKQLRRLRHDVSYITARKRVEKALLDGTIVEAAQFRAKATRGRFQKVYVKADVENVQLVIEKALADKGELVNL